MQLIESMLLGAEQTAWATELSVTELACVGGGYGGVQSDAPACSMTVHRRPVVAYGKPVFEPKGW